MAKYQHLFFDLDHTLWDFETNSRATLHELHDELELTAHGVENAHEFVEVYEEINLRLWQKYRVGKIDKAVLRVLRFRTALKQFGINNEELAKRIDKEYLRRCPHRTTLMPGAVELLDHLCGRYELHIITNGFQEVQSIKMQGSGITEYFDQVITSEQAHAKKPDPRIFHHAMKLSKAQPHHSLMIGDSLLADVRGAKAVGMDQVHFDPKDQAPGGESTYRVRELSELQDLL